MLSARRSGRDWLCLDQPGLEQRPGDLPVIVGDEPVPLVHVQARQLARQESDEGEVAGQAVLGMYLSEG